MSFARPFALLGLLACLTLMSACSKIFSPAAPQPGVPLASPTATSPTTPTFTATPTGTPTATSTPLATPQFTPTASPTGCSSMGFTFTSYGQTVSPGSSVTFSGYFGTSKGGYACYQTYQINSITFHVSPSWTSANQVTDVLLYQGGTLVDRKSVV